MENLRHIEFILAAFLILKHDISFSVTMTTIFGRGYCLTGVPFEVDVSIGPSACVKDCLRNDRCLSVTYWLDNFICEFFSIDSTKFADYFENSNCVHYGFDSESFVQVQQSIRSGCPMLTKSIEVSSGGIACIEADCPEPLSYGNVLVLEGKNYIDAQRQCECKTKYTTVPADVITCQQSLTWTEENMCAIPIVFNFEGSDRFSYQANSPWDRTSGPTYSLDTGPSGAFDGSKYMYFETSHDVTIGMTGELILDVYFTPEIKCLEFYYSMYGEDIGVLSVYYIEEGASEKNDLWNATGDMGTDEWFQAKFSLDIQTNFKLIFEASDGGHNFYGDIAVDYIVLSDTC